MPTRHKNSYVMALAQLRLDGAPGENLAKCLEWTRRAAAAGANVVCLPELCGSHYFCQSEEHSHFDLAEPVDGPTRQAFGEVAGELGIVVVAPFFERRAPGLYHNSALVLDSDGASAGLYRKMHIPDDPGFYEKFYFTPGDLGFISHSTAFGEIGVLICWDQWFPEGARLTAMRGAETLFFPTAIGWHPAEKTEFGERQRDAWITAQRAHAVANGVYVAAVNRIGLERPLPGGDGIEFWGSSFICGPQGEFLARAGEEGEELLMAEVSPRQIEDVRRNWPFLRDRRVDAYGDLGKRFLR